MPQAKKPNTLPAVVTATGRSLAVVEGQGTTEKAQVPQAAPHVEAEFESEPPVEIVIDAAQLKDRIIEYLGAVLARCWTDRTLLDQIAYDPHTALRHLGILLPSEIDIKVERPNQSRPRLVIYEWDRNRSFRRRICYLQLIMMAGQ
jgi:hypothetical protein